MRMSHLQALDASRAQLFPHDLLILAGVAHGRELAHQEVVPSVVGRRVFADVCELLKLREGKDCG